MKIQAKIAAIRRLLTELETILQLPAHINEPLAAQNAGLQNAGLQAGDSAPLDADKIYSIIGKFQPIHKRGITRKSYWITGAERNRILEELCFKNKIIALREGKKIIYATIDRLSTDRQNEF